MGLRRGVLPLMGLGAALGLYGWAGSIETRAAQINIDEGWYLYAAWEVRQGKKPYLDFPYVQPPLLPYVYGGLGGFESLERGRRLTLLLGGLAILLTALAAWRAAGAWAGCLAGWLLAANPYTLALFGVVKAYALADLFLALALVLMAGPAEGWLRSLGAGLVLALGGGVRNTVWAGMLALGWSLWGTWREMAAALAGALAGGLGLFLPFGVRDAEAVGFHVFQHHAEQFASTMASALAALGHHGLRFAQANPFLTGTLLVAGGLLGAQRGFRWPRRADVRLALGLVALVGGVHFISAHPYLEYHGLLLPPLAYLAAVAASGLAASLSNPRSRRLAAALGLLWVVVLPGWLTFLRARSLAASLENPHHPMHLLQETALWVRKHSGPDGEVFTLQPYLAIEAQRRLCPGTEVGAFSYYADLPLAEAERFHVLNRERAREYFASRRPAVVALTAGDVRLLGGRAQKGQVEYRGPVLEALAQGYRLERWITGFGQFGEELYLWLPRP